MYIKISFLSKMGKCTKDTLHNCLMLSKVNCRKAKSPEEPPPNITKFAIAKVKINILLSKHVTVAMAM